MCGCVCARARARVHMSTYTHVDALPMDKPADPQGRAGQAGAMHVVWGGPPLTSRSAILSSWF